MAATAEKGAPLCCIYSGAPLDPDRFALDHFLP